MNSIISQSRRADLAFPATSLLYSFNTTIKKSHCHTAVLTFKKSFQSKWWSVVIKIDLRLSCDSPLSLCSLTASCRVAIVLSLSISQKINNESGASLQLNDISTTYLVQTETPEIKEEKTDD